MPVSLSRFLNVSLTHVVKNSFKLLAGVITEQQWKSFFFYSYTCLWRAPGLEPFSSFMNTNGKWNIIAIQVNGLVQKNLYDSIQCSPSYISVLCCKIWSIESHGRVVSASISYSRSLEIESGLEDCVPKKSQCFP